MLATYVMSLHRRAMRSWGWPGGGRVCDLSPGAGADDRRAAGGHRQTAVAEPAPLGHVSRPSIGEEARRANATRSRRHKVSHAPRLERSAKPKASAPPPVKKDDRKQDDGPVHLDRRRGGGDRRRRRTLLSDRRPAARRCRRSRRLRHRRGQTTPTMRDENRTERRTSLKQWSEPPAMALERASTTGRSSRRKRATYRPL